MNKFSVSFSVQDRDYIERGLRVLRQRVMQCAGDEISNDNEGVAQKYVAEARRIAKLLKFFEEL
jgi:hypothetical protein